MGYGHTMNKIFSLILCVLVAGAPMSAQTLQSIMGLTSVSMNPFPFLDMNATLITTAADAAGESVTAVGIVALSTGPGTSKVISSAGGKVCWLPSTNTFANGTTNLRIGAQDVSAGAEDGSFDVQADLVGGTDTITAGAVVCTAMESGTKTIAHGDTIAISAEMTARGGADSVLLTYNSVVTHTPNTYVTVDTGSGPALTAGVGIYALIFDDGTVGWIMNNTPALPGTAAPTTATTPDEYATIFQVPFATSVCGITAMLDNIAATDTYEILLYSDPLGTPVAERTITVDPTLIVSATADGTFRWLFTSAFTPTISVNYAAAFRPTSANAITIYTMAFGSGNAALRATTPLGTNWQQGTRVDNAGAFTANTEVLPAIGPILCGFSDGAGGRPRIIGG